MGRSTFRSQGTANSNALEIFGTRKEPEDLLWSAVLSKAADDALYSSDFREAMLAIGWFEGEGRDFRYVCQLAGRDPNYVLKKILKQVIERKRKIKEWEDSIKEKLAFGMARKSAILSLKNKIGGKLGRKHKGGYHRDKRKYIVHPDARAETLQ